MKNKVYQAIIAASVLTVLTFARFCYARVFTYIPDVPWSMEKINDPVGREFKIYCTRDDSWAVIAFIQTSTRYCGL
jgi:hypothetical protein